MKFLLVLSILLLYFNHESESKAAARRGGFSYRSYSSYRSGSYRSYSSYRSGGYRSSYRSYTSYRSYGGSRVRVRARVRYRGFDYNRKVYLIGSGGIYISPYYRTHYYPSHQSSRRDFPICYNDEMERPGGNGTTYGFFVCPINDDTNAVYCCGYEPRQTCCSYWGDPGRAVGAVIGILILIAVILGIIYCIYRCNTGSTTTTTTHHVVKMEDRDQVVVVPPPASSYPSDPNPYKPVYPDVNQFQPAPPAVGFTGPPSYPVAPGSGYPPPGYPAAPAGPGYPMAPPPGYPEGGSQPPGYPVSPYPQAAPYPQ